ncbi:probable transcriptional regulatory protein At2g25830 [Lolium rigidum]|uniref:probable transcriptional regulatory protein At2g25830 n=1 Tax=Lolium rigidum TaxID=89674 RepID=UPI001F5C88FD|nr:probable transcriptional regulatory protein At2g25830 [Lolium rigidum]
MASAARALGALLHRASSLSSSASALRSASLLHRNGSAGGASLFQGHVARRRIWTFQPLCMGRRSCKIAGRKGAQNLKKMKRNSKIGKEIVAAIKKGGPSPSSNTALAAILEKVRELDVPKEVVERNIKRASEKGQDTYIEKVYEVYGFGGVSMVVEVLTDKITRSIADIRNVVKDCGAKLADPGSVTFRFQQARVVNIKVTDADKDQLLSVALDAGADDVIEPNFDGDDEDSEEDVIERFYKIVTTSENYPVVLSKLQEEGIKFETDNGYELLPLNPVEVDDEAMDLNKDLVLKLLELDDVDAVYTDQK